MNNNSPNLSSFCRSIGLIYDRTTAGADPIGSTFLVAEKKVASLASLILPFSSAPQALKVVFPSTEREFGVSSVHMHSRFDSGLTRKTMAQGTLGNGPEAALQKFNCCVLQLVDQLPALTDAQTEQVSQALRYPLNLTDEGFRGSLTEIELPLVIQTLNNAKKQGTLYICDNLNRPLAQIYCQGGRIVAAKYRTLINELAIYQIVEKRLTGRFAFRAGKPPMWVPSQTISRSTDTLLIEAMRRQDEITGLKKQLATSEYFFVRAYKQLYMDAISPDNRKAVELIWRALDGTTPAEELWNLVPLDDYTILSSLNEMYTSNQCMRVPLAGTMQFVIPKMPDDSYAPAFLQSTPLPLGTQMPLSAFDTISSVSIDPINSKPRVKVGALLGAIDPYDPIHLLHDIPLLPWASGSPLIKDDMVIGMHCGVVPNSSAVDNTFGVLQQMLWGEALEQILKSIPGTAIPPAVPLRAEPVEQPAAAKSAPGTKPAPGTNSSPVAKPAVNLEPTIHENFFDSVPGTVQQADTIPDDISSASYKALVTKIRLGDASVSGLPGATSGASSSSPSETKGTAGDDPAKDTNKDRKKTKDKNKNKDAALKDLIARDAGGKSSSKDATAKPSSAIDPTLAKESNQKDVLLPGATAHSEPPSELTTQTNSPTPTPTPTATSAIPAPASGARAADASLNSLAALSPGTGRAADASLNSLAALAPGAASAGNAGKPQSHPAPPQNPKGPPGCREIASLKCAICGERTFNSARRCPRCQHEFVPQLRKDAKPPSFDLALPVASVIILLMAASAALAWSRLPQPVFANVELMSKPVLTLTLQKAISERGKVKWRVKPSGTTFSKDDSLSIVMDATIPSYVYLFDKGHGAASLIVPGVYSPINNVRAGGSISYPAQLEQESAAGKIANGFGLDPKPGLDEFLAIAATPRPLKALENVETQDQVFENARAILKLSKSDVGNMVPVSRIRPAKLPVDIDANDGFLDPSEMVYITLVTTKH